MTTSVKTGSHRKGCFRGPSNTQRLLSESVLIGSSAAPITCVRSGAKGSIFYPSTSVAENVADVDPSGLWYSSMLGYTLKVSNDLTSGTWAKTAGTGGSVSVIEIQTGVFRITYATGTSWGTSIADSFTAVSNGLSTDLQARKVSGNADVWALKFAAGNPSLQTDANLDWQLPENGEWVDVRSTGDVARSRVDLQARGPSEGGVDTSGVIEIRDIRAADSIIPHAPSPPGSAAGYFSAPGILSSSPSFGTTGTLIQCARTYGWSGIENPGSLSPRLFAAAGGSNFLGYTDSLTGGVITFAGSGTGIAAAGSPVNGVPFVSSFDWNGTTLERGLRLDSEARITGVVTGVPSAGLSVGNSAFGNRVFHGAIFTLYWKDKILTDYEYSLVQQYMQASANTLRIY